MPTLGNVWRGLARQFKQAGLNNPDLDARLLTGFAVDLDDLQLLVQEKTEISEHVQVRIQALGDRRLAGEPVARIVNTKEFYGLDFALNAHTLVPRPETELLVDLGLAHLADQTEAICLDLGTGTGCIPISLLAHQPGLQAVAVDISGGALAQAQINAVTHGVEKRFELFCGTWFSPLPAQIQFDLITANPPYIQRDALDGLANEVRLFDPIVALDGGVDGLHAYRDILQSAKVFLKSGGLLLLEIGYDQARTVRDICQAAGFENVELRHDLAGHPRVIMAA